jgi:hypothetical protein
VFSGGLFRMWRFQQEAPAAVRATATTMPMQRH